MTPHPGCSSSGDAERGASTMSFCPGFLLGVHGSRAEFESLSTTTALLVFVQFTRMLWLDVLFDSCLENTQEDHGWGSADENWPTETAGNGGGCLAFIDSDRGAETRHPSIPVSTADSSHRACLPGVGSWQVKERRCPDTGRRVRGPPRGGARTVQEGGKLNNAGYEDQTDNIVPPSEDNSLDFLLVPWIRIRLPVQGTWVRSLALRNILHDTEQIKPVRHNY